MSFVKILGWIWSPRTFVCGRCECWHPPTDSMKGVYDPWGFGNSSFVHLPFDNPFLLREGCTCPHLHCGGCQGDRDAWKDPRVTPKSTPGRTRKIARRAASSAHALPAWHRQRLHRSHEDLLSERRRPVDNAISQAFFNLPRQAGNGLSRSVSCLSSSQRTLVKVEHDFLPHQKPRGASSGLALSRSTSCLSPHQAPHAARRMPRRAPAEVLLTRSKSAKPRPVRTDRPAVVAMATRPLPPTPTEEPDRLLGFENPAKDPEMLWVKAEYYGRHFRRGSVWQRLSGRFANPKLNQDDQGYLEPLPPPLPPPRRLEKGPKKWKCQEDTGNCLTTCAGSLSCLFKLFLKATCK